MQTRNSYIGSAEQREGCPAGGWVYLVGPVRPTLLLTEGPMKADVIHALSGLSVLAVPSVNSLTRLEAVLADLRTEGF